MGIHYFILQHLVNETYKDISMSVLGLWSQEVNGSSLLQLINEVMTRTGVSFPSIHQSVCTVQK